MSNFISISGLSSTLGEHFPEMKTDFSYREQWRCQRNGGVVRFSNAYKRNDLIESIDRNKSTIKKAEMYNTMSSHALIEMCNISIARDEKILLSLENNPDDDFEGDWKCFYEKGE